MIGSGRRALTGSGYAQPTVAVRAEVVSFPTAADRMKRVRPSAAESGIEEEGKLALVQPSTPQEGDAFADTFSRVNWGIAEALRFCGFLLVVSAYGVVLWFTGSTIAEVLRSF